jgi:ferrous iron transport protein A
VESKAYTVASLVNGQQARITDIDGGHGVRQHLAALGIHPGDTVAMIRKSSPPGPFLIEIHGFRVALGRDVAGKIRLEAP